MIDPATPGIYLLESLPDHPRLIFARVDIAPPRLRVFAKADEPNTRWITLKPHGKDDDHYVHVKIRMNADGTGNVISGKGGLRGLKLTRLASPDELKERAKKRREERKERAKREEEEREAKERAEEERAAEDPEYAQQRAQEKVERRKALEAAKEQIDGYREVVDKLSKEAAAAAARLTGEENLALAGMDESEFKDFRTAAREEARRLAMQEAGVVSDEQIEELPSEVKKEVERQLGGAQSGGSLLASRDLKRVRSTLAKLERGIVENLVRDDDLAKAVLNGEADADVRALDNPYGPRKSRRTRGYKSTAKQDAEERGYGEEEAKEEAERVRQERLKLMSAEQREKAETWRKTIVRMNENARELDEDPDFESQRIRTRENVDRLTPDELQEKAEQVREFLKHRKALRDAQRKLADLEAARNKVTRDPDAAFDDLLNADLRDLHDADLASFHVPDEEFLKELEQRVDDAAEQALTTQFLEEVEEVAVEGEGPTDLHAPTAMRAMRHHVASGSGAHFANVALTLTDTQGLDRMALDTLGLNAGAALTAHMLRRDLDPEELADAREALRAYHDTESLAKMREAMDEADAIRAEAAEIEIPPVDGSVEAAVVADLIAEKRQMLEEAQQVLGGALGEIEAGAALNLALGTNPTNDLRVEFGQQPTAQIATALRALGLDEGDYTLSRDVDTNALTAVIDRNGMDKLVPQPKASDELRARRREWRAIKNGALDEEGWLPDGFVRRPAVTFERPQDPPSLRGEPAFGAGRDPNEALGEYAGSLYADGMSPMQVYQHLTSQEFLRNVPPDQQAAVQQALEAMLPAQKRVTHLTSKARDALRERLTADLGREPTREELDEAADRRAATLARQGDPDGQTYTEVIGRNLDAMPEAHARLEERAQAYLREHFPGETTFHSQRVDASEPEAREALFRVLAEDPMLQAAYLDPNEIGGTDDGRKAARAVRDYYLQRVVAPTLPEGVTVEQDREARKAEYEQAIAKVDDRYERLNNGALPGKWRSADDAQTGMFGGEQDDTVTLRFRAGSSAEQQATALVELGLDAGPHYTRNNDGSVTLTEAGKDAIDVRAAVRARRAADAAEGEDAPPPSGGPLAVVAGGLDRLNPQYLDWIGDRFRVENQYAGGRGRWAELVEHAGSPARAYAAVQEHMRGAAAKAFHENYGRVKGKALRISKLTTEHHRSILKATDEEALQQIREREQEIDQRNREREGGKFAFMGGEGALTAKRDETAAQDRRNQMATHSALFTMTGPTNDGMGQGGGVLGDEDAAIGGETQARGGELQIGPDERYTLGHTVETTLKNMLADTTFGIGPKENPTSLIPDVSFGSEGRFVGTQRFIKGLEKMGKLGMFFGTGSGKTSAQLGAFTHLRGGGKVKKGLFVVPSSVRNQFGQEAMRFMEPGKYQWHAHSDSFEGRKAAYQGATDMIVTTHATFRDDMVRLMAEAEGVAPSRIADEFREAPRKERAKRLGAALQHHGIDPQDLFVAIDEGHDFLNRAGKEDSLQSSVLEGLLDNVTYATPATGSPIKNDLSEAFDWLAKLDPDRFNDRDAFMRRYAVNSEASREAFQRLMANYSMVDARVADVPRETTWGRTTEDGGQQPIPLTDEQQAAYHGMLHAYEQARRASRSGTVDVAAMRMLSPRSFEGLPESEHAEVAAKLNRSLGTLKHGALARVLNEHPAESNAKVQHTLQLADRYRSEGKAGVIFAHHKASIAMLREQLEGAGHKVGVIDGAASSDEKARVRAAFDRGDVDIVLASDAGKTGMNLQKRGRWLVHYDLPNTQMASEQRTARIDRIGQQGPIDVHHLQTDARFDDRARRRIERKARLGSSLQGEYQNLSDTGLERYLALARDERQGDLPDADDAAAPPLMA